MSKTSLSLTAAVSISVLALSAFVFAGGEHGHDDHDHDRHHDEKHHADEHHAESHAEHHAHDDHKDHADHDKHDHDDEHRQHGSHVHGIAQLTIASEGKELAIELLSPAANITGFEHQPENQQQRDSVNAAVALLKQGSKLFGMPKGVACEQEHVDIKAAIAEESEHDHGHSEHKDTDKHPKHDDHDEHHGHEGHEDHDDHDHESSHSDLEVTYEFHCDNLSRLSEIDIHLFEHFSAMEKLNVQFIVGGKQGAFTATQAHPHVEFR